ncbi:MAG: exodeoxyribonuclease III [Actinomycetota bacterium]
MRIATVNVNGVRAALRKGMLEWLDEARPDVVCMQEVRAPDSIVQEAFADDWHVAHQEREFKGRAGVAILSRMPLEDIKVAADVFGPAGAEATHTGRWVEGTVATPAGPLRLISTYIHSGEVGSPKQDDKMWFLDLVTLRLAELSQAHELAVAMGDVNIAHTNLDIKNWKGNLKSAGFLPEERAYLDAWFGSGWVDVHRTLAGEVDGPYTWWSQRGQAFDNDAGWRIDYQIASSKLAALATTALVHRQKSWDTRWTDHAPLVVDYSL